MKGRIFFGEEIGHQVEILEKEGIRIASRENPFYKATLYGYHGIYIELWRAGKTDAPLLTREVSSICVLELYVESMKLEELF